MCAFLVLSIVSSKCFVSCVRKSLHCIFCERMMMTKASMQKMHAIVVTSTVRRCRAARYINNFSNIEVSFFKGTCNIAFLMIPYIAIINFSKSVINQEYSLFYNQYTLELLDLLLFYTKLILCSCFSTNLFSNTYSNTISRYHFS